MNLTAEQRAHLRAAIDAARRALIRAEAEAHGTCALPECENTFEPLTGKIYCCASCRRKAFDRSARCMTRSNERRRAASKARATT